MHKKHKYITYITSFKLPHHKLTPKRPTNIQVTNITTTEKLMQGVWEWALEVGGHFNCLG
jgi:hypothetical protein